jgi:hypothetical protein
MHETYIKVRGQPERLHARSHQIGKPLHSKQLIIQPAKDIHAITSSTKASSVISAMCRKPSGAVRPW